MTSEGSRRFVYSITFHVDEANMIPGGAYAWAESARSSLCLESVVQSLWQQGIAIIKDNGIRDISAMLNGQWVSRAALDVAFRTVVRPAEDTGYISSIVATGNVDGEPVIVTAP